MIAALSAWHEQHDQAAQALDGVVALPAHVVVETYAVLTRLPSGLAVPSPIASRVISRRFPGAVLGLDGADRAGVLSTLADAGVFGGATYDGLVGLVARAHDRRLLTLDRRAQATYGRLGVAFVVIGD